MNRVGVVFVCCLAIAVVLSLAAPKRDAVLKVDLVNIDYGTSAAFNVAALAVIAILTALYATWW
jgi:SSS family solute:Na+ symporter